MSLTQIILFGIGCGFMIYGTYMIDKGLQDMKKQHEIAKADLARLFKQVEDLEVRVSDAVHIGKGLKG